MRYFIAVESAEKPFILWASVANSTAEYEALGFDTNPLVLAETDKPEPLYGVCPFKIVAGELVFRTNSEMNAFQDEYNIRQAMIANVERLPIINDNTFTYDSKLFPMDEVSRLFYTAMEKIGGNQKIMTTSNEVYSLLNANIAAFMTAYYTKLLLISKHNI